MKTKGIKSRLIRSLDLSEDGENAFKRDVSVVLGLSPEAQKLVAGDIMTLARYRTRAEQQPIIRKMEAATGLSVPELNRAINVLMLFISAFNEDDLKGDKPEDWADDLEAIGCLGVRAHFLELIGYLRKNLSGEYHEFAQETAEAVGVMPFFAGISSTVELRAILEKEYEKGTDVSNYEPVIARTIPIVSVAINVDSGMLKRFMFQARPKDLEYVIRELQAAVKTAGALAKQRAAS